MKRQAVFVGGAMGWMGFSLGLLTRMARMTPGCPPPASPPPPAGDWHFAPVERAERADALSLLLSGQTQAHDPSVSGFLDFAREQNLSLDHLWACRRSEGMILSAMLLPCAGRTALIFLSPNVDASLHAAAAGLVGAMLQAQNRSRMRLVQALLDPGHENIATALVQAGFLSLATLVYMQRESEKARVPLDLPPPYRLVHYSRGHRDLFARAVLATYEATLDCPGLLGLRDIDDILDGHMATGRFVPELWHAVYHGEEPAAVMLLNQLPQRAAMELVYLGLAKNARGQGLGTRLLRHGLSLTTAHGCTSMILAVDADNGPALKLYQRLAFQPTTRKLALIRSLDPSVGGAGAR